MGWPGLETDTGLTRRIEISHKVVIIVEKMTSMKPSRFLCPVSQASD